MLARHRFILAVLLLTATIPARGQLPLRHEIRGQQLFQGFGGAIARMPDHDGDGADDLLVGSPSLGRVDIISGRTGALLGTLLGPSPYEDYGYAVAGIGDVDGDGIGDLAVGAPGHDGNGGDCGRVLVHSGADFSIIRSLVGDYADDRLGSAIIPWSDLDGDGRPEMIVGAPSTALPGYIRVFAANGTTLVSYWGQTADDGTGSALARVPDLDGDGLDELAVGAPRADWQGVPRCGRVLVLAGSGSAILFDRGGLVVDDGFGASLATVGDLDGDGLAELLIGIPGRDQGGPDAGALELHSLAGAGLLRAHIGTQAFALLGQACAALGDVDGDGVPDYGTGAWFEDLGAVDAGALRVHSGSDGRLLLLQGGGGPNAHLGERLCALGDGDGDGLADLAVALPGSSAGAVLGGAVRILSVAGFRRYGRSGFTPTLDLAYRPATAAGALGQLELSGAGSWSSGLIAVSLAAADIDIGVLRILVAPDPSLLVLQHGFLYDQTGSIAFAVDLRQPYLAGVSLWMQSYDLVFPYGGSNGLEMRCLP
ncbi:MAG: VCBS repeat-containing protein [Planctomycetes bacterium]|nr:VCBS repeat-containing protein [Planctomycetota bacterium]